jgi:hypothetical protein
MGDIHKLSGINDMWLGTSFTDFAHVYCRIERVSIFAGIVIRALGVFSLQDYGDDEKNQIN